ncbi:G protein-coupled glucose receptor regulating Gpa2-domain-containing protein [Tricladium varicosporioides]|nr:G protein-coupled glucose receptor regulating Gpa2-domain-containing protein [Hymenoscyphus varicosporioides]
MLDLAIAIPTLTGSILSMFAAGFVFVCYLILPPQIHFRHTLILNLAAADFLNALNNTTSGIYAFIHGSIPPGVGCTLNGFIGQATVQATDFAILSISIATLITLRRSNYKPTMSRTKKMLITPGIWFVPACTSFVGLILNDYKPVSGNWCWLSRDRYALRYILSHGWRITIIFTVICLYTYLFIYIHRHFSSLRSIENINAQSRWASSEFSNNSICVYDEFEILSELSCMDEIKRNKKLGYLENTPPDCFTYAGSAASIRSDSPISTNPPLSPCKEMKQTIYPNYTSSSSPSTGISTSLGHDPSNIYAHNPLLSRDPLNLIRRPINRHSQAYLTATTTTAIFSPPLPATATQKELLIQKLLLLNAYPIAYVLLWLPGMLNRALEASGHPSRTLMIAQASTQFVGLANALVYGYNERISAWAAMWWRGEGVWAGSMKEGRERGRLVGRFKWANLNGQGGERKEKELEISWPIH